ncbi:MAG: hypothetical protein ABSB19_12720 [Methylomonas sp.]|jgi:hypothetical protein
MKARASGLGLLGLIGLILSCPPALADENSDLDLIPNASETPLAAAGAADKRQRIYLQNVYTLSSLRSGLITPYPPPAPFNWQERLFLDVRKEWALAERLNLTLSDRFNLRAENDLPAPGRENILNSFREGFLSWEPYERVYLDAGRINVKSGVAAGYNPTDFFKTRAVVAPLSADPSILREDRLGALMLRAQHIWAGGALMAAFAPKVSQPSQVYVNTDLRSLDPSFDRTNADGRLLLKGSADIAENFSPELLFYHEGGRSSFGANLAASLGQSVVAYAEWAGGSRGGLIDEALRYGRATGSLPMGAPDVIPADSRLSFRNDLSVGASYTAPSKITFNLEYHYHQAGFSGRDWNNWFGAGGGLSGASPAAAELWFIRAYAQEQQEPVGKHSAVLRADWADAFIPKLQLTGFVYADLYDMSGLAQLTADYYLSNAWTVGALASADLGGPHTDFGSLPQAASIFFKVARYF